MKTILTFLFAAATTLCTLSADAQTFGALGGVNSTGGAKCLLMDDSGSNLYVGGTLTNAGGTAVSSIAHWDGTNWNALGAGLTGNPGSYYVEDMVFFNGNLVAGGYINGSGGNPLYGIAEWDGTNWNNLSFGVSGYINAMASYGGKLYVGGNLGIVDGTPGVWTDGFFPGTLACWDGTQWDTCSVPYTGGDIKHMMVWNNTLIVGGDFGHIWQFDGSSWTDLSGTSINDEISALGVYNGNLMVAELTWGGEGKIWEYDGTSMTLFHGGFDGRIRGMVEFNGDFYVAGQCDEVNGFAFEGITYWDGSNWNIINQGISGNVEELIVFNNQLIITDIQFDRSDWSYYGAIGTLGLPTAALPPATPTGLVAKFIQDTSAVLTWDTSATATSYKIVYKVAGASAWQSVAWKHTQQGQLQIGGLAPGTTYKWAMFAINQHGYSQISPMSSFTTLNGPCTIPVGLSTTGIAGTKARLNWTQAANAVKYRIRYREQGTSTWTTIAKDGTWDKHWLTGLSLNTTYEWQIKSVCSVGTSSGTKWSPTQMFTTLAFKAATVAQLDGTELAAVRLYPNPSTDGRFLVAGVEGTIQVTVFNTIGQPVYSGAVRSGEAIDLSAHGAGVYFLKTAQNNREAVTRLIVR